MRKVLILAAGLLLNASAGAASAAVFSFSGTRSNVNPLLPPGSGRCAAGAFFNTVFLGGGNGTSAGTSNFGAFTYSQSHCLVTAPPTSLVDGLFTYDFGSGDQLFGTYTGDVLATGTPGLFTGVENLIATGGTGRFEGASGSWTSTGQLRFGQLNGQGVGIFDGAFAGTLNVPAVPEPATWAMMVGGFGLIGYVMRNSRRHRRVEYTRLTPRL